MEITINGKTYKAKPATLRTLIQDQKLSEKLVKAVDEDKWDLHEKLYVQRCGLYLEGDVSELRPTLLSPEQGVELAGFFISCLGLSTQKSNELTKTSPSSTESEAPEA